MSTHQTPTTPDELLRLYLRGLLDAHSFNTHLLLILIDLVEEQRLLRGLLDASTTELQVQARDLAALASQGKVSLPSQAGAADEDGVKDDGPVQPISAEG